MQQDTDGMSNSVASDQTFWEQSDFCPALFVLLCHNIKIF